MGRLGRTGGDIGVGSWLMDGVRALLLAPRKRRRDHVLG